MLSILLVLVEFAAQIFDATLKFREKQTNQQ